MDERTTYQHFGDRWNGQVPSLVFDYSAILYSIEIRHTTFILATHEHLCTYVHKQLEFTPSKLTSLKSFRNYFLINVASTVYSYICTLKWIRKGYT